MNALALQKTNLRGDVCSFFGKDINNIQQNYELEYVGQTGYNGELIFNFNSIKDFNINTSNIAQNKIFINSLSFRR